VASARPAGAGEHVPIRQRAHARANELGAVDLTTLLRGWERASRVADLGTLGDRARFRWHAAPRTSGPTGARGNTRTELAQTSGRLAPPGKSDVRKNARPWRSAAPLGADLGHYRCNYTRARLEARWAIRLDRWPRPRQLTVWCPCLVYSRR